MQKLKNRISLIKQDSETRKISSIESVPSESIHSRIDPKSDVLVDCDMDSVLSIGKYDIAVFDKITSANGLSFPELLPVIAMDVENKVLMQAFLNKEALSATFRTGYANYFSRSRGKIWLKGESSHHRQEIVKVEYFPKDLLFIYVVKQNIAACHDGFYSCFYRRLNSDGSYSQIDFDRKFNPDKVYG